MSYVYLLENGKKTYVGATIDPDRRLRQHNREISGGARATAGGVWKRVLFVSGIPDWRSALQLEWAWKHATRKSHRRGVLGRIEALFEVLDKERCTSKAKPYAEWGGQISLNVTADQKAVLEKIETCFGQKVLSGPPTSDSNLPTNVLTFLPFRMSSKSTATSVHSSEMSALLKAVQALTERAAAAEKQYAATQEQNKLLTALIERLSASSGKITASGGGSAAAEAPVKGKRGRKPRAEKEPKEKPAPPAAADGTIRFGSASEGDYKEFSSFYKSPFVVGGKEYISLANFFNSQKFADTDEAFAEDIRTQKNPALTRAKASSVKEHPVREDWDTAKLDVMRAGLLAKFRANTALKRKLLATGDSPIESTIEEEMRLKGFWSIGEDGSGANNMGQLLASVRDELRASAGDDDSDEEEAAPAPTPVAKKPAAKKAAAPAPAAKKPAPAAKAPAPAADSDSDSDSDDSDDEEESTPAPKAVAKPVAKATPAPKATKAPSPAEDSDEDESDDDDE